MSDVLAVILSPARLPVDPGGSAQVILQVQNHGGVVDEYTVEVLGEAAAWTVLDRSRVAVFPEGIEAVQATIQPPRESFPQAGDVPVGFRVRSSVDPTVIVVEECHLDLKPFIEIGAEVRPKTAKGRFSASHNLRVINRGNAPVSVSVRAEVQQGDVEVSVPPAPLIVGVGARATTKVKVKPSQSHWSGGDEMHSYRLNLSPKGGAPIAIDAMMRQRPIARVPTALILAVALVLGGAYVVYGKGPNPLQNAASRWHGAVDIPLVGQSTSPTPTSAPTAPPSGPPCTVGVPTNVSATSGNAQATVKWTAPATTCGVTGYTVTSSPAGGSASVGSGAVTAVVNNLTNGTQYTFVVTASGAGGPGAPSSPSNPVTPLTVPSAPQGITASAGDGNATVTWKAPISNGGSPVTGYVVTSLPSGGSASVSMTPTGGTASVTHLANGTSYTFAVAAINSVGTGPSATSGAATPTCTALSSVTVNGATLGKVAWSAVGTCFPYSGTVRFQWYGLLGIPLATGGGPFSATGPNPNGTIPYTIYPGSNRVVITVTLTDTQGKSAWGSTTVSY